MALKYSKQREAIKEFLATRTDHPTADVVYMNIRKAFPNISLGTVYRNLSLLASLGEVNKMTPGDGADHFDWNTEPHYHVVCTECGCVQDLPMELVQDMNKLAEKYYDGVIDGHNVYFYGKCSACLEKLKKLQKSS